MKLFISLQVSKWSLKIISEGSILNAKTFIGKTPVMTVCTCHLFTDVFVLPFIYTSENSRVYARDTDKSESVKPVHSRKVNSGRIFFKNNEILLYIWAKIIINLKFRGGWKNDAKCFKLALWHFKKAWIGGWEIARPYLICQTCVGNHITPLWSKCMYEEQAYLAVYKCSLIFSLAQMPIQIYLSRVGLLQGGCGRIINLAGFTSNG